MISGRQRLSRASSTSPSATRDAKIPRDSNSVTSQHPPCIGLVNSEGSNLPLFIPASPPFERSKVGQALIDCITVTFGIFFLCMTAASVPVALFLLIFCKF
jgi:hypothetical protein